MPTDFPTLDAKTLIEEQGRYGRDIDATKLNELWNEWRKLSRGGERRQAGEDTADLALIRSKLGEVPLKDGHGNGQAEVANCFGILREKLGKPCLFELIWSYWHEEAMLVQTMKAIACASKTGGPRGHGPTEAIRHRSAPSAEQSALGIHSGRTAPAHDPAARLRVRSPIRHRAGWQGCATLRAADSRSKFIEAFHNLLHRSPIFFKPDDDTTIGRRVSGAQWNEGSASALGRRHAQPVWRPAIHGTPGNAHGAVDPGAARDARVPRWADDDALQRGLDGSRGYDEEA